MPAHRAPAGNFLAGMLDERSKFRYRSYSRQPFLRQMIAARTSGQGLARLQEKASPKKRATPPPGVEVIGADFRAGG
jgi:hypothetical protein